MLVRQKKNFIRGVLMLGTFALLFVFLLFPVLHDEYNRPLTGLQFADNVFNELSKGSSNFIPMCRAEVKKMEGRNIDINVAFTKKPELKDMAVNVLTKAGAKAEIKGDRLYISGDLGAILGSATDMSEKLYNNDAKVAAMYDLNPADAQVQAGGNAEEAIALKAARAWWYSLSPAIKALQKQDKVAEAKAVDQIMRRAIEPGNNFYSLNGAKVKDHVVLLTLMLVFYLLYTLWYGFSIFELFRPGHDQVQDEVRELVFPELHAAVGRCWQQAPREWFPGGFFVLPGLKMKPLKSWKKQMPQICAFDIIKPTCV